tara:strand:- start:228 stop:527 length:300 start_codon:yes stop_codon:yes gene_type:complete
MLKEEGIDFVPVGIKKGELAGKQILDLRQKPEIKDVDTVTLYIGPRNQPEWYEYIFSLNPRRIIFNPGTENPEFIKMASEKGIEAEIACTLVMLSVGNY